MSDSRGQGTGYDKPLHACMVTMAAISRHASFAARAPGLPLPPCSQDQHLNRCIERLSLRAHNLQAQADLRSACAKPAARGDIAESAIVIRCQCPFRGLSRLRNGHDPQNFRSVFACRFCHRIEFTLSRPLFQFLNVRLTGCRRHRVDHEPRRWFTIIGRRTHPQFAAAGCQSSIGEH